MYVSPGEGGRWYCCGGCNFSGDSIELYKAGHNIKDVRSAIAEMVRRQLLPISSGELNTDIVTDYIKSYVNKRLRNSNFFEHAKSQLLGLHQDWLSLMRYYNLWGGRRSSAEWGRELGMFLGGATREDAYRFKLGKDVPESMSHFLVCPFYDVPGRISSFLLIGRSQTVRISCSVHSRGEDGLMMLDATGVEDDIVIATSDPMFALQLQRKNFVCDTAPLKVVVFGVNTDRAWMSLCARRVIFWEQKPSFQLFNQSRKHARSYIARRPSFLDAAEYFRDTPLTETLESLSDSAVTWAEALKIYVLEHDRSAVYDTIKNLELTAYEMSRIYELCSTIEREKLKEILGEKPIEQSVYIMKKRVIEADGAWWIAHSDRRELLCNAIIRILKAVHAQDSGINRYEGTITFNGKTIRFNNTIDEVERLPGKWLREQMMAGGLGVPIIQKSMMKHLIEIAKQFCAPTYSKGFSRIGWYSEEQAFIFPNFSIRAGKIDDTIYALTAISSRAPAANIVADPLSRGDWDMALADEPENAVVWATISAFMANLVAPVLNIQPSPVCLAGGVGSAAHLVGKHLAIELGMVTHRIDCYEGKRTLTMDGLLKKTQHDYPFMLEIEGSNATFLHRLRGDEKYNLMVNLHQGPALALAVGNSWVFVHAPDIVPPRKALPKLNGVMRFLVWLQLRNFSMPVAESVQHSILLLLKEWADEELRALNLNVFDKAAGILHTPEGALIDRKLLQFIFWICEAFQQQVEHDAFYAGFKSRGFAYIRRKNVFIFIDDDYKKVYVNVSIIEKALRQLPSADLDTGIQELAAHSAKNGFEPGAHGFVLGLDYWNEEAKRWRQSRG